MLLTTMPLKQLPLLCSRASTKASSLNQHNLLVSPSSDSQNTQSHPASQLDTQLNSTPPSTPVFITGSSIIQNLEQGVSTFNGTNFNVKVRTKSGYSILDMIQSIQMNQIDSNFHLSAHTVFCIGSIHLKKTGPDESIKSIQRLIQILKDKYPKMKLAFATIPPQFDPLLKPKLQQFQNGDIDEFNRKLLQLSSTNGVDTIHCNFQKNMLNNGGIHLN
ncbi:unnamed protein product, partial [Didymodactylos carnosus]